MAQKDEKLGKTENDVKNAQKRYYELQMLDQQMKQMQQYLETFDQQLEEIEYVIESLESLKGLKRGDEMLAPVANGIFVKAKLEEKDDLLINVGNDVVVKKSVADGLKMLESQKEEVQKYRDETLSKMDEMIHRIEELQLD